MTTDNFNLSPPPHFRGLQPDVPVSVYHRHLPHWRQADAAYFATFRLADSLPQEKLRFLKRMRADWERNHPTPRSEKVWEAYARQYTTQVERWLDEGYGECHFSARRWADDLRERLHYFEGERYRLFCWAILPNHCHVVIRPTAPHSLEDLLGAMKGVSARHIQRAMGTTGSLWEEECYDRIVRDEEHLWRIVQYIGRNPRAAGLAAERWIHPEWDAAGWRFVDE